MPIHRAESIKDGKISKYYQYISSIDGRKYTKYYYFGEIDRSSAWLYAVKQRTALKIKERQMSQCWFD